MPIPFSLLLSVTNSSAPKQKEPNKQSPSVSLYQHLQNVQISSHQLKVKCKQHM